MDVERARVTLAQFVLRARRVEAHTLAADRETLEALLRTEFQVVLNNRTGMATITREYPPEEQLESLAARLRPITLQRDTVYWGKTLTALGALLTEAGTFDRYRIMVKQLRGWWTDATAATAPATAITHRTVADGTTSTADNRTLAQAWLYGDVIHADEERLASTRDFGVEERYLAAVPYIARLAVYTRMTLDLIRHTMAHGGVELPAGVFEGDVIVHGTRIEGEARVWTAELGAPMPTDASSPLPSQWRPFEPGDLQPAPPKTDDDGHG